MIEFLFCPIHGIFSPVNLAGFLLYVRQGYAGFLFLKGRLVHNMNRGKA